MDQCIVAVLFNVIVYIFLKHFVSENLFNVYLTNMVCAIIYPYTHNPFRN